jgi:Flp pilus assembly protein TadG
VKPERVEPAIRGRAAGAFLSRARIARVRRDDRGSVTLWIVIFSVAAFALATLLVDGGTAISAKERAADIAEQAARAAANDIAVGGLRGNVVQIAPGACQQAANLVGTYQTSSHMSATMTGCNTAAQLATVKVSVTTTPIFGAFIGSFTKQVTETAKPECGINQQIACP